jgi:eukaryotic-like serine/threonine-protein kinase
MRPCKGCGASLPAYAPDELCPKCLAESGIRRNSSSAVNQTVLLTASSLLAESKTQPAPADLPASHRLGGYRIIRPLGQGGMGAVYEAEEIESGRRVALKVLSRSLDSPEARRRFLREGRLAASVNHPNTVYVFGTDEIDGQPVIAMELVSGGTLHDRVKQNEPMPIASAVDAILQVIAGLEAAAALGVLHRDIKPSNCFIEADGTVKVGDFGLSVSTATRGETKLTMTGSFLGTPAYSSPEQLRGDEFTLHGDIYAIGVTLYFLLTGRTPFQGDDLVRMLATVLERAPESPGKWRPELPKGLCRAILRCLEKQPAKRFKNYAALRNALLPYSSAATSPATLSLRFLAGYIDQTLLSVPGMLVAMYLGFRGGGEGFQYEQTGLRLNITSPSGNVQNSALLTLVSGMFFIVLYFTVFEGLWGASIGKRLCRLRVVGPNRSVLGIRRAFARAAIWGVVPNLPAFLAFGFGSLHHVSSFGVVKSQGMSSLAVVIIALLFSTARRRNGFAAVQDLLTGTRVVRRTAHTARPALEAVEEKPPSTDTTPSLGPYHVLETLAKGESEEILLAFDTRLLRKVWIRKLPCGAPPVAPALRNLARVGRLRWLNGKRTADECWDAYEAVSGKPFLDLVRQRQPWSRVRFWLLDLAEEIHAGLKEQSPPESLQLDRVWITADGRAKLLDFPAPGSDAHAATGEPTVVAGASNPQPFLNQVAVAALEGRRAASAEAKPSSVAIPLPLHARELLGEMQTGIAPGLLADRLRPLLHNLAFVSRWRRFGLILGCNIFPLIAVAAFFFGIAVSQTKSVQTHIADAITLRECLKQLSEAQANRKVPGGLDGQGNAFSANLLGPALNWKGMPFKFGSANDTDVVAAIGQTIALPAGHFTNLALLATAIDANQPAQVLTVTYVDNKSSKWEQGFSDWFTPQEYHGESFASMMAYRNTGNGKKVARKHYLYGYTFQLDSNRTARSLTLPRNPNIEVLALTLEPPATTVDLSTNFNQANGIVADKSTFTGVQHREALEVYIAGRFRHTITNPATWNRVDVPMPRDQRSAAQQLMARRSEPTDLELKQAAEVVEPNLKGEVLGGSAESFDLTSNTFFLIVGGVFVVLGAIPSFLAALLFRGGLVMRMLNLEVVKKDGSKASRKLLFERSFLAWFPVILMGALAGLLFPSTGLSSGERALLCYGYCILTACLMICAALLTDRGLHDRISGTCLVPRE